MKSTASIATTTTALISSLAFAQTPPPTAPFSHEMQDKETEVHQLISMPKSTIEFIKNIRYSFNNNLFLEDSFFKKYEACMAFSIDKKNCDPHETIYSDGTHSTTIQTNNFSRIFPQEENPLDPNTNERRYPLFGSLAQTAQLDISKTTNSSGVSSGRMHLSIFKGGPSFEETTQTLQIDLSRVIEMPPHGKIITPATGPHGNEKWRHTELSGKLHKDITIEFHADGTLYSIYILIDEIGGHQQ